MLFVMPSVQVDVDTSIGTLLMRNRTSCNPLAYSIRPDTENLCRLWHRVPPRPRRIFFRHALRHALIMPAVLGILPPTGKLRASEKRTSRRCYANLPAEGLASRAYGARGPPCQAPLRSVRPEFANFWKNETPRQPSTYGTDCGGGRAEADDERTP